MRKQTVTPTTLAEAKDVLLFHIASPEFAASETLLFAQAYKALVEAEAVESVIPTREVVYPIREEG